MSLGGDRELLEGLQIGTVDFAEINTSVLASIIEELAVIDLPFMFTSVEHANRVLDGKIGDVMIEKINNGSGIIAVAWWENGFRCFTNNKRPITKPGDLKGLVMRSMQSNIHLETFKLWGANPTPMAFSEMLTAMQQGVIDGHDNNPDTVATNSMWEFQKYFSESLHFYGAKVLAFSPKFWGTLSDSDKEIFRKAAYLARDREREESLKRFSDSVGILEQNNMQVAKNAAIDIDAFIKSVQPIWDSFRAKYGDELITSITNG
jgi:tripartite ATP-independent transporter DctP family solute receptor